MTTKPICDVSSWQGVINYPQLISMTDGVIIRAGNGITPDAKFAANWAALAWHPGLVGAYWFVRSDYSPITQAQLFNAQLAISDGPDVLVMDAEKDDAMLTTLALRAHYKAFLDKLASLRPGVQIAVYTRATYWDIEIGVAGWENSYPLWVAHYTNAAAPAIPAAWSSWWLWQYSADGNNLGEQYGVSSDDIDLNRLAVPIVPPPVDPPPAPAPWPKSGVVSGANGAWLRTRPFVTSSYPPTGTRVLLLPAVQALVLHAEIPLTNGYEWYLATVPGSNTAGWVAKHLVTG